MVVPLMNIELIAEDLLTIKADACVSSIHRSRDLRRGPLARQILNAAGEELQTDIRSKKSGKELVQGEVVSAHPKKLASNFKTLYFVCLKKWMEGNDADLQKAVDWILKDAEKRGYSTIIFPPLGTGGQDYPENPVALAILQAIIAYSIDNAKTKITVKIALFHQKNEMLQAFADILEEGVSITSQGDMTADTDQKEKEDNIFVKCQRTVLVRPTKKGFFQSIAWLFGRPPTIFAFQIGPATLSGLPYVNVQQRGAGGSLTVGLTISVQLLPQPLAKKLSGLY